jgi:pyruvate formate lyase activating enzyme
LVVPGFNDTPSELESMARFIASVSPNIPWHVTAFHQDYKMVSIENTAAGSLLRAAEVGRNAGLKFVYAGNLPGMVREWEDTCCPGCHATLIRRRGFRILENRIGSDGLCPECNTSIPGVWSSGVGIPSVRPVA